MNKILLVDDEPNILLSLEFVFKKEGYQVLIARDGEEAMALLRDELPDLIILDIMMPKVDGYEVCTFVRHNFLKTKVVFLSAKSKEKDLQKGLALGADRYLTKPFSTKGIVAEVKKLIN
jgi:DNA-binding response OmpR family regulator